jgi:hypothetical protein
LLSSDRLTIKLPGSRDLCSGFFVSAAEVVDENDIFRLLLVGGLSSTEWIQLDGSFKAIEGLRPYCSAQVRSHGTPGQVGEPGAPVQFLLGSLRRLTLAGKGKGRAHRDGCRLMVRSFRSSRRCCHLSYRLWLVRGRWARRWRRFATHVGPKEALRDPPGPRAAGWCSWVTDWK